MTGPIPSTVLVVDDNQANRYVLTRLLTRTGYRVLEAATGAEALTRLAEYPDVVVLDVNLPDIKGTEIARQIKTDPLTAGIMVLNMSASFTRTQDRIECLDSGADGYLTQPLDPPEFLATVASLLRIHHAEEAVRRANNELERFAAIASHDLQEPLRMVANYMHLLERRCGAQFDDTARRFMHYAVDGAARMSTLVNDLLSLARSDQAVVKKVEFDSGTALADALDNLELRIAETKAQVTSGPMPTVSGDRSLLSHVFQNLIANGIKFCSGTPAILINATDEAGFHVFTVADNGIGIPLDQQGGIFDMFHRLHGIDKYPGSGIGLALCKRIIERHGGSIGVRSQPGTGSTFWFSIPKVVAPAV